MVKTIALVSLVLASRQSSRGLDPLPASGDHWKSYCTEARSSRVFFAATPILPQPRFSFPSRHSLVCHQKHFWFIFQGHSAPETWLHCTCSASLSKCPWQASQSLDSVTFFFFFSQTGNPPSFHSLRRLLQSIRLTQPLFLNAPLLM